jgi:hypothetical protein
VKGSISQDCERQGARFSRVIYMSFIKKALLKKDQMRINRELQV